MSFMRPEISMITYTRYRMIIRDYTDTFLLRVRSAMCIGDIRKMEEEDSDDDDSSSKDSYYLGYELSDNEKPLAKKTIYSIKI